MVDSIISNVNTSNSKTFPRDAINSNSFGTLSIVQLDVQVMYIMSAT